MILLFLKLRNQHRQNGVNLLRNKVSIMSRISGNDLYDLIFNV